MKIRSRIVFVLAGISACALLVVSQQTANGPDLNPGATEPPPNEPPHVLALDRTTWDVFDPSGRQDLSSYNTDEARLERFKAVLALEYPEEYRRQFPLTAAESTAAEASALAIEHPKTIEQYLSEPRGEEEQQALESSLNPETAPDSETVN